MCSSEVCRKRHQEWRSEAFRLSMCTTLNLSACPSSCSMHTLLAFIKEKVDEAAPGSATGRLQAFLMAHGAELWIACSLLPFFCLGQLAGGRSGPGAEHSLHGA